jgi:hypothetical protein
MIIDRIRVSGIRSYLEDPNNAGSVNLAAGPIAARTVALEKGQQWEIAGLHFVMEASDLSPLFDRPQAAPPLFSITIQKEMFPGLFADPYRHRVHNIAGFEDFKRGAFENCTPLEVDGIPTLVSIGTGDCRWVSRLYETAVPVSFDHASWELAVSRKAPSRSFTYTILLRWWTTGQPTSSPPTVTPLVSTAGPKTSRVDHPSGIDDVAAFQIEFTAKVQHDARLYEKHTAVLRESLGLPLLRAVNLLEPVPCSNDFHTLDELLARCSEYHLFEGVGGPVKKLWASLDLSAALVNSPNQNAGPGNDDYEFVEISTPTSQFVRFQARLDAEELLRPRSV